MLLKRYRKKLKLSQTEFAKKHAIRNRDGTTVPLAYERLARLEQRDATIEHGEIRGALGRLSGILVRKTEGETPCSG